MSIKHLTSIAFINLLFVIPQLMFAQQTMIYDDPEASFKTALDLIEKKQFGAAQEKFHELMPGLPAGESVMRLEAQYFDALCDYKLDHPQAKEKFTEFIENYPDHTRTNLAYLNLGLINYNMRKYRPAIEAFEEVDPYLLGPDQVNEYLYKLGYSYLKNEDYDKAKQVFIPILNTPSDYQNAANYYFGYLAYMEEDYQTALKHFEDVENDKAFGDEIPIYLLQINYIDKDYDEIIRIGPDLVKNKIKDKKKKSEAAIIVAEAFYEKNQFALALPYFEQYEKTSRKSITREQKYKLAYAYHQTDDFDNAITYFEKVVGNEDKLTQNAYYHLADCYLETGQKQFAQNAFYSAYQMEFDEEIQEDALFNYAKLTFELAYDPFNQSMTALKQYIADYPGSDRLDEAYAYLINLFYSTKDYEASIDAIENIRVKTNDLRTAYQKITFMRGVQLFNANRYEEAMENFRKSLGNNYNSKLTAEAKFWMGETHYRLGDYHKAIDYYDNFMVTPGAYNLPMYPMTKYNLGYTYFMLKYYDNAVIEFQQFIGRNISGGKEFQTDAILRMGDCYFITKNYEDAIDYYEKAIVRGSPDSDYATYQMALSEGALGNNDKKIIALRKIVNSYPSSSYLDDAYFETATTYMLMNDNRNALSWFDNLLSKFPNSSYVLESMQKKGLVYYNENDYSEALASLKKVVEIYPGTDESKESLMTIRNIYMDQNQVDDYYAYAENIPFANVTANEQDSITYLAAENLYMNNQCGPATEAFGSYINKFPTGAFMLNANFYKAECELRLGNTEQALEGYNLVLANPRSKFTENTLIRAGEINFDNTNYTTALENFNLLELNADYRENLTIAYEGQMECNYRLDNFSQAMQASRKLLGREKLTNDQVLAAHFILAKSALAIDSVSLARKEFEKTIELSDGERGAEAKYMLATIQFTLKNYVRAEEMIFELANEFPASEYWKAKGFIMLADIYAINGNIFQAKQTLQSILDHYPGQDLKDVAGQKLTTIIRQEQLEEEQADDSIPEGEGQKNGER